MDFANGQPPIGAKSNSSHWQRDCSIPPNVYLHGRLFGIASQKQPSPDRQDALVVIELA